MIAPQEVIFANEVLGLVHIVWRGNSYFVNIDSEESRKKFCTFLTEKSGHPWVCWENHETDEPKRKWVFYRGDQFEVEIDEDDLCYLCAFQAIDGEIDLPLNTDTYASLFEYTKFKNPALIASPAEMQKVKSVERMFLRCNSLKQLDVSHWNVSSVQQMGAMFFECASLKQLDVSNWDVSNAKGMVNMFAGCKSLEQLDVSNWDVSNAVDIYGMFAECKSLAQLDVSRWDIPNVVTMSSIFNGCPAGEICLPILTSKLSLSGLNTF